MEEQWLLQTGNVDHVYHTYKPYLTSIAYRMLGSLTDAEDIVQDIFHKLLDHPDIAIQNLKFYLSKMVTNRCINELQSARKKREVYTGTWLPEPLVEGTASNPEQQIIQEDALHYALLVLMEKLSAKERAVYVLKEAFHLEHAEIASLLGLSEANSRKLYSRAKQKLQIQEKSNDLLLQVQQEQITRFVTALSNGNIEDMADLLTDDVTLLADGGGNVTTAINEIISKERVLILLQAMVTKFFAGKSVHAVKVNGRPGILVQKDNAPVGVFCFAWKETSQQIQRIYYQVNPDKLQRIEPASL